MNEKMKNVPNILSFARIILTPIVIALFLIPSGVCKFVSFALYFIASCTDFLDGYIARKYNAVSDMGKLLDASADKFLQTSALILVLTSEYNVVSMWISVVLMLVFLLRDSWMSTIRQLSASKGVVVSADIWGKIKSILMDVALGVLFLYCGLCSILKEGQNTKLFADLTVEYIGCFGIVLLAIAGIFCILSCINYTKNAWGVVVKGQEKDSVITDAQISIENYIESENTDGKGIDNSQK